ncbi:hypothetical protein [Streptomyces echinatus]|uniref:Uncharacterized protein n=1 Tax=Streptomyces echinatus TaxID=67293 RepID=A0A7W9Q2V7_9ACTN|nr:hypothetical protein [Streptomyces echinatus]MBB5932331.1 hypothetical protein [Streptomyces echinatus]
MAKWRNQVEGGAARTDDNRGPKPTRAWQSTGPGGSTWHGITPEPGPRQGEDSRTYRRARVTAS